MNDFNVDLDLDDNERWQELETKDGISVIKMMFCRYYYSAIGCRINIVRTNIKYKSV